MPAIDHPDISDDEWMDMLSKLGDQPFNNIIMIKKADTLGPRDPFGMYGVVLEALFEKWGSSRIIIVVTFVKNNN